MKEKWEHVKEAENSMDEGGARRAGGRDVRERTAREDSAGEEWR